MGRGRLISRLCIRAAQARRGALRWRSGSISRPECRRSRGGALMSRPPLAVVKVGGSLFDWPELPGRLTGYLKARQVKVGAEHTVLVAGGGPAADWIRRLDEIQHLG